MNRFKKEKTFSRSLTVWKTIFCVFMIAALLFILGGAVFYAVQDPSERSLRWVKNMVRKHYYIDIPEETLSDANLSDLFGDGEKEPLLDIYSAYYTKEEYAARLSSMAGNQSGIGISVLSGEYEGQIFRVTGNSPAEESGLKSGMYIVSYGTDKNNLVSYEQNGFFEFLNSTPDGVNFTVSAAESKEDEVAYYTLYKAEYVQNYVFYEDCDLSYRYTGEKAETLTAGETILSDLPVDAAYIRLDSFSGGAAKQLEGMLNEFKKRGKKRLVLDLRNNGGGQISVLCDIASYLCKNAEESKFPVTVARYKNGKTETAYANGQYYSSCFSDDAQIFVLANQNTASASEALIGAMLDYGTIEYENIFLSEIDGTARTYGKGIMQSHYVNRITGEAVKLTSARVCWPKSDNCIHGRGILPEDGAIPMRETNYADCKNSMLHTFIASYLVV